MSQAKHTPGPWQVGDAGHAVFGPPGSGRISGRITVAQLIANVANARLIAAAPDLLVSLIELLSCVDQHTDDQVLGPIIESAKIALKKARGEK